MNKKVSILIPMYNAEAFVRETLDSCLKQTYKNIEIIVVDDGSNDRSFAVAKEYESDARIKVLSIVNSGACKARNVALDNATGDYIMYLDADDIISSDKIEQQVAKLEKSEDDLVVATCRWDRFGNSVDEAIFPPQKSYRNYSSGIELLLDLWNNSEMFAAHCYLIPRKLACKAGRWREDLLKNQDGEYFSRVLLNASSVYYCGDAKVYYRTGTYASVSKEGSERKIKALLDSFRYYKENVLSIEDSERTRVALAKNFSLFMYLYYGRYTALCLMARDEIRNLGLLPINVGTGRSRKLARLIGFENFLRLRSTFLKY